jgi:glutathione peroxidase
MRNNSNPLAKSIYDFKLRDINGKETSLNEYKGQVALLVNVASKCGLTPQYEGLQKLFEQYKTRSFVVLGFPANNFGAQEPGTDQEIKTFCSSQYKVSFPMFSKISVKGADIHPLYKYLTTEAPQATEISWNFQKFLVDREGQVIANFNPQKTPDEIAPIIEAAL